MFHNQMTRAGKARRMAAMILAGTLAVGLTAAPASAQGLNGGGKVYAGADCNLRTKTANVAVTVLEPPAFATTGLIFYTEVWAKARHAAKWDFIKAGASPLIKTWSQYNPNPFVSSQLSWFNNPTTIFTAAFTGNVEAYYDIYVRYWSRTPSSTTWTGPSGFTVAGDPDSSITITSNDGYGNLSSPASDCYL